MMKRSTFTSIIQRVFSFNHEVLNEIVNKMQSGNMVSPVTESEKECFQLMRDLGIIGKYVKGSLTFKRCMHNEIWSLITLCKRCSFMVHHTISC